ncbi:MAG: hypothetical protein ACRD3K_00065, partial [Edaphobacter sp.]
MSATLVSEARLTRDTPVRLTINRDSRCIHLRYQPARSCGRNLGSNASANQQSLPLFMRLNVPRMLYSPERSSLAGTAPSGSVLHKIIF